MPTTLAPYLSFAGNCAEAMAFYREAIANSAGDLFIKTHAEAPPEMNTPPEWRDKVLHARLVSDSFVLQASDIPPAHRVDPNPMVNLSLGCDSIEQAEKVFSALSADGTVFMPLGKTFWAERFGMLRDRYGFSWMVSFEHS